MNIADDAVKHFDRATGVGRRRFLQHGRQDARRIGNGKLEPLRTCTPAAHAVTDEFTHVG